ncbi:MAG: CPBP family intramembrane metalloprotease [Butyrivibrio sp.]|nr:CPBP family intramembrane metalloprotease [Butyrivibrio sp.]
MNNKKANWLFLCMILCMFVVSFCLEILIYGMGINMSIAATNFVNEMSMFIPAVIFILCTGDRFSDLIPLKKVKITTLLLVPVYLFLVMPLCYFANSITMLFVENTVAAASDQILAMSFPLMVGSIGIFAPIIEESCYRGVLFHSYKRSGRTIAAIVLSSLLFGIMHLNLNQAAYAFLLGVMFAILVEATGSIITSMLAHMLLNTSQVLLMYWEYNSESEIAEVAEGISQAELKQTLIMAIGPLGCIAIIGALIAVCLAYAMAKNEGRGEYFRSIIYKKPRIDENGKKETIVTVPLIIAVTACVLYIIVLMI